jgi:hypothetical protein
MNSRTNGYTHQPTAMSNVTPRPFKAHELYSPDTASIIRSLLTASDCRHMTSAAPAFRELYAHPRIRFKVDTDDFDATLVARVIHRSRRNLKALSILGSPTLLMLWREPMVRDACAHLQELFLEKTHDECVTEDELGPLVAALADGKLPKLAVFGVRLTPSQGTNLLDAGLYMRKESYLARASQTMRRCSGHC